jgi:hypothetical protein
MALLSVMLFEGIRLGTRGAALSTALNDRAEQWSLAYGVLRRQLAGTESLPVRDQQPGTGAVDFEGSPDTVRFIEAPPAFLAPGGLYRMQLAFVRGASAGRLMLGWTRLGDAEASQSESPSTLIDNLASVEFSYFGSLAADQAPQWQQNWRGADHLPTLVRLHITFADGRGPPDLIVALRLAPLPQSGQ